MSKFEAAITEYMGKIEACDEALLRKVTKGLGPSIYLKDASMVSCSDKKELERVKNNFLIKKHGLTDDGTNLDAEIKKVCDAMKDSRQKKRGVFYYHLVKNMGLEGNY